jgi:hypothetical protein
LANPERTLRILLKAEQRARRCRPARRNKWVLGSIGSGSDQRTWACPPKAFETIDRAFHTFDLQSRLSGSQAPLRHIRAIFNAHPLKVSSVRLAQLCMDRIAMRLHRVIAAALSTAILAASGCADAPVTVPLDLPTTLHPPAGQSLYLVALASGVQIYECAPKSDQASSFEWVFRAPEAALVDHSGRSIGKHYAGPTWESIDGSTVVGEVKSRDPGPSQSAIPWLLLASKSTTGTGVFSQTKSIQRLQTAGGIAPTEPCTSSNAKQVARIPYTAIYYFYRGAL